MRRVRRIGQALYYRLMSPIWRRAFSPRIVEVSLTGCEFRFFIGNHQAADWYDPPQLHTMLEYDWVLANVDLNDASVIDAGAHHGHYALVFARAHLRTAHVVAVEPFPSNCALIEVNSAINQASIDILQAAVASERSSASIVPRSNSRLFPGLGLEVSTVTLADVMPEATVVKLDIEGQEFEILPGQIEELPLARTWIVEVHPKYGNPHRLADGFLHHGFRASFVDRAEQNVVPYSAQAALSGATSMFFQRD